MAAFASLVFVPNCVVVFLDLLLHFCPWLLSLSLPTITIDAALTTVSAAVADDLVVIFVFVNVGVGVIVAGVAQASVSAPPSSPSTFLLSGPS